MISPKFFRKITYINTLSALACHVPLAQIDIPPAVYTYVLIVLPLPSQANFTEVKTSSMRSKLTCQPQLARRCSAYPSKSSWDLMARKVAYRVYCVIVYCTCERQVGLAVTFINSLTNLLLGMEEEGLFRRSPNSMQLRQVREAYNRGDNI